MARPVVAVLTDFGTRDHYAGTMKGVALDICPDLTFVDLTHDIAPQDILGAAFELAVAFKYFPAGTVFLVVVDPGVGSSRRAIAAEAGSYRFVGPDNGVLCPALDATGEAPALVELTEPRYARPFVSKTFEGRDRFAPAAAWLARGVDLNELGRPLTDWTRLQLPAPLAGPGCISGQVLRIDRFGNAITNLDRALYENFARQGSTQVIAGSGGVVPLVTTYADAAKGSVCALFGSADYLEIAVSGGNASEQLGLAQGSEITLRRGE
ncbi:MAG: SAM-dependent chlorinase/fluorinase [Acidobacteria bacterium]|nr:SAM-dependent chlorinase/fluorinase [Acidobacteriota bacterium]